MSATINLFGPSTVAGAPFITAAMVDAAVNAALAANAVTSAAADVAETARATAAEGALTTALGYYLTTTLAASTYALIGAGGVGSSPSTTTPLIDGTAAVGVGTTFARADHVHPTDTTRYAAANPSGYQTAANVTATVAANVPGFQTASQVTSALSPYLTTAAAASTYALIGSGGASVTPSNANPLIDGTATSGTSALYTREDHVHPTDTTRYAAANPSGFQTAANVMTTLGSYALTTALPGPATVAPLIDGSAAVGTSTLYARQDHVHPGGGGAVSPSTANPLIDGTAAPGTSVAYTREDHVHPTDTTRYAAANPSGYQTAAQVTATVASNVPGFALTSAIPVASSTTPVIDGTATIGVGATYARADHIHPTDTTRYAASNPSAFQTAAQVTATVASNVPGFALTSAVPGPASVAPLIDGTAAIGTSLLYARQDHVHPGGGGAVSPSTINPLINGTAAPGTSVAYTREDHVHPTDTTRYSTANPSGFQTAAQVTATIASNVPGFLSSITSGQVTTALSFTPYNATNPSGFQTAGQVTTTLGPYALTSAVPVASSTTPVIDGTAAVGSSATYARADHVHPTDTSRYAAGNPSGFQTAAQVATATSPVNIIVPPVTAKTAAYTLAQTDNNAIVPVNVASSTAVILPTLTAGTQITVQQAGAGKITWTASGVTMQTTFPASSTGTAGQGAVMTFMWQTATSVLVFGGIA